MFFYKNFLELYIWLYEKAGDFLFEIFSCNNNFIWATTNILSLLFLAIGLLRFKFLFWLLDCHNLKFSLFFSASWAVRYMHKNWAVVISAMVLSKLFFLSPPSDHIVSLFSPTFSHNFNNIIADIHLSPPALVHRTQINSN